VGQSAKDAWNEVGERFSSWGRHLTDHYKQAGSGESAKEAQRKLEEAARHIGNQLDQAFKAIDGTLRDTEAKKDLKDAVGAIGTAVSATIDDAGNAIRRRGGSDETWAPPERPDDEPPATD
jgi:phage-related minor tail protein